MPQRGSRSIATLSLTSALDGVGGQRHAPAALPSGKTWYPLYRRLGGPQGRSGRVRKISPLLRFDPRTVQSVASRYIPTGPVIVIIMRFFSVPTFRRNALPPVSLNWFRFKLD